MPQIWLVVSVFVLFPFMVIFQFSYLPPCATVPSSLQARGRRPRDCNKGIFVLRERKREKERGARDRKMSPSLPLSLSPLPLKKEYSLYQKLWASLDKREKVNKSETKLLFDQFQTFLLILDIFQWFFTCSIEILRPSQSCARGARPSRPPP